MTADRPGTDTDDTFQWDVPDTFNFSADVVDQWAEDPDRLALITADDAGNEQRFTYAGIAAAAARLANLLTELGRTPR